MHRLFRCLLLLAGSAFTASHLQADDTLNTRLYKVAAGLSIQNAKDVKSIRTHFAAQKLGQRDLILVYAYWLMQNIAYDCDGFSNGTYTDKSTTELLRDKKAVCYGYSKLFTELCNTSGIHTYLIKGFSKGYGYQTGKIPTETDHAWNLLKLDSNYYLFDITWAAGYVQMQGNKLTYIKKADPSNLFADPRQFVQKHLPVLPWFQLLSPTVSAAQFLRSNMASRSDQSAKSISIDFKKKLDMLDTMSYIQRTMTIVTEGEKFYSMPLESAGELSILAYNLISANPGKKELKLAEKIILDAQKIMQKVPNYKKQSLWANLEQNLNYVHFKLKS